MQGLDVMIRVTLTEMTELYTYNCMVLSEELQRDGVCTMLAWYYQSALR